MTTIGSKKQEGNDALKRGDLEEAIHKEFGDDSKNTRVLGLQENRGRFPQSALLQQPE